MAQDSETRCRNNLGPAPVWILPSELQVVGTHILLRALDCYAWSAFIWDTVNSLYGARSTDTRWMLPHTHNHTYAYSHAYIHTCTHTHIYIYIYRCIQTVELKFDNFYQSEFFEMRFDVYYFGCDFLDCCPHLYCTKLKYISYTWNHLTVGI